MDATTLEVESSAEKTSINPPNDIFFRLEEIDEVHQARRSPVDTVGRTTVQGSYALRDIPTTWRAADLLRGMVPNLPQFSLPDTFFLLNEDMESYRNPSVFIEKVVE